jgi:hypothetical protein
LAIACEAQMRDQSEGRARWKDGTDLKVVQVEDFVQRRPAADALEAGLFRIRHMHLNFLDRAEVDFA